MRKKRSYALLLTVLRLMLSCFSPVSGYPQSAVFGLTSRSYSPPVDTQGQPNQEPVFSVFQNRTPTCWAKQDSRKSIVLSLAAVASALAVVLLVLKCYRVITTQRGNARITRRLASSEEESGEEPCLEVSTEAAFGATIGASVGAAVTATVVALERLTSGQSPLIGLPYATSAAVAGSIVGTITGSIAQLIAGTLGTVERKTRRERREQRRRERRERRKRSLLNLIRTAIGPFDFHLQTGMAFALASAMAFAASFCDTTAGAGAIIGAALGAIIGLRVAREGLEAFLQRKERRKRRRSDDRLLDVRR